jgi:cobalt-zinc-cadmium efflux system outer membrane protein
VGVELPFFTRNMDGVRAAEADAEAARLETVAARLKSEGHIRRLYARLETAATKSNRLKQVILPAAERTLNLVKEANKQGKAGYLDVLEARRTLLDARYQIIETVTEYDSFRIDLERLTATESSTL